jgi:hypothetical protein
MGWADNQAKTVEIIRILRENGGFLYTPHVSGDTDMVMTQGGREYEKKTKPRALCTRK